MAQKIRRDDTVTVISGRDIGKKGKVLRISAINNTAIVERVNMVKKHLRRRRENEQSGVVEIEAPIHLSNLMLYCKHCDKPSRFKIVEIKDGSRNRVCKKCNEVL